MLRITHLLLSVLLLISASAVSTAADRLMEEVIVRGSALRTAAPPEGLVLHKELGLLTAAGVEGQVVHTGRPPSMHLFETRATKTPAGDLLLMFPEGEHYGASKGKKINEMIAYRSSDSGRTWKGPTVAFDIDYNQHGFIPLVPRGKSRIYAFGTQPIPGKWSWKNGQAENAPIGFRWSDDDGRTWSPVQLIEPVNDPGFMGMSVMRMCETSTGAWILGSHHADWSAKPLQTRQYMLRSDDQGKTWMLTPGARPNGWFVKPYGRMDEGRPIALKDGKVLAMLRTPEGHLWSARSEDDGRTWSEPAPTTLVHPDAPPMVYLLADGKTLAAFHHNRHAQSQYQGLTSNMEGQKDRSELWVSLSQDEGRTWSEPRFVLVNAFAPKSKNSWYDYNCSYIDCVVDGDDLHVFMPHRWERALHLRIKAADLTRFPTKDELTRSAGRAQAAPVIAPEAGAPDSNTAELADICVYGGTSGGVIAAIQASRMKKKVVLLEPGKHLGGMTSSGLGAIDIGNPKTVGGIAREYFTRLAGQYGRTLAWDKELKGVPTGGAFAVEPHSAERVFNEMIREAGVTVHFEKRLASVKKSGARITEVVCDDGSTYRARVFIDTTYEGDLMAAAGVKFTLERESNATYGETLNGVQFNARYMPEEKWGKPASNGRRGDGKGIWDRDIGIDPYIKKGDPSSGLLPLVSPDIPGPVGSVAPGVQAYCYRLCLTDVENNRVAFTQPEGYDPARYEMIARFIEACRAAGDDMDLRWFSKYDPVPKGKYDFNTATFGGNLPGASWEWPEASYKRRAEIAREHELYHRGLFWFLLTDKRVPEKVREELSRFGLCKDEFPDTDGWPHQIYVRQGRRMISELVMTQAHCESSKVADSSVGLASYGIDVHEIRRVVRNGQVVREGKLGSHVPRPYPIGYAAIVPKKSECENLFVPFALSASHVAFGSIRMEPVFMVISQSAATAASVAIESNTPVQAVPYDTLRQHLIQDKQVVDWKASHK